MSTEATGPEGPEAEASVTVPRRVDVSTLPDGSGNDRDDDERDDERFDAG